MAWHYVVVHGAIVHDHGFERAAPEHDVWLFRHREANRRVRDLVNCGGFTAMKKIAALAEAHYVGLAPHNPNGPVATLMNLQLAASIPNFHILETLGSEADAQQFRQMTGRSLPLENGALPVPTGPGFDVELDESSLPPATREHSSPR
jgi:galactonate dehydratase